MTNSEMDQPERYNDLTAEQKQALLIWITKNLEARPSLNRRCHSYGLAHLFESSGPGFSVSPGVMKGAMLAAGYRLEYVKTVGWCFNVRENSLNRYMGHGKKYHRSHYGIR